MRMTWFLCLVCLLAWPLLAQGGGEEASSPESEEIAPPKKSTPALEDEGFEEVGNYNKIIEGIAYEAKQADNICWVLDHSPSMADDVKEITTRIETLLGGLSKKGSVLNSIVIWSDRPKLHLKPTTDIKSVKDSLGKIAFEGKEGAGVENVCAAVNLGLANRGKGAKSFLIVVTDEAGDDDKMFDRTIEALKSAKVTVLVLSPNAAFGAPLWNWDVVHYDKAHTEFFFSHNGPENGTPEALFDFNFVQRSTWSSTINPMEQRVWATKGGWAPYFLQHMAEATGGKVYEIDTNTNMLQGEFVGKRRYKPEIIPLSNLASSVAAHPWRLAVDKAAKTWTGFKHIAREFPGRSKTDLITGVQSQMSVVDGNINITTTVLKTLQDGLSRKPKKSYEGGDENLRWRANIELAFASALVARYHLHQFKLDVERFKGATFWPDPQNDVCQWNIKVVPDGKSLVSSEGYEVGEKPAEGYSVSDESGNETKVEAGPGSMMSMLAVVPDINAATHEERRIQAEKALLVVLRNHPKTPWATVARKLKDELGSYDVFINPCGNWGNSTTSQ